MDKGWELVNYFLLLAIFIGLASTLKKKFSFFRKYLIPVPIIAGFIGLLLSQELVGLVTFNKETLGFIVYHLMAIGFISLSLQNRKTKTNKDVLNGGLFIVSNY